jgi:transposase
MLDKATIFEIHRLHHLNWAVRKIARTLRITRKTVTRHLNPDKGCTKRLQRPGKMDAYDQLIRQFLQEDPEVKAPVVRQRLMERGFTGGITIVRQYLHRLRGPCKSRTPFVRFESMPAEQVQIDWGHFGSILYGTTQRKLYALAVCEPFSRMLYVEFTHCQKQDTLHQCLLNAFSFFGGTPKTIVVDNMLTAVIERQGRVIRFNDRFLDFLKVFPITPVACNPGSPHEKGKIESSIKYLRTNFFPLRSFKDLDDINSQVRQWLSDVANVRVHKTTGERPLDRFQQVHLTPLADLPDCRYTSQLLVHKDFAVRFDTNTYTVPPWTIGKTLTLKADRTSVRLFLLEKEVAAHARCYMRNQRIELAAHVLAVKKLKKRLWYNRDIAAFCSLGKQAVLFLDALIENHQPIQKSICRLLCLKDQYGSASLLWAIEKAAKLKAFGADYVENILYQEMTPTTRHLPVTLKDEALNRIRLTEPCLAEYDSLALKRSHLHDR